MIRLKRIAIVIAVFIALVMFAGAGIAFFYGKEIKYYLVSELNKQLKVKVSVKDVSFTVLRYFPDASVVFKEVHAQNSVGDDTLCNVKYISLLFNLKDIFHKNYTIRRVYIYKGLIKLSVDEAGNDRYIFWDTSVTATKSKFNFKLSQLQAEDIRFGTYISL